MIDDIKNHNMPGKKAILVLGMHRSGTSLLTRIFGMLGARPPLDPLPPSSDNPIGYWESPQVIQFNDGLLREIGSHWKNYSPLRQTWFDELHVGPFRKQAEELLKSEFGDSDLIVLKCPRICLLVPFWTAVLRESDYQVIHVILLRDPQDVFKSLMARSRDPELAHAAIVEPEHSALLWLRYVLDSEYNTRGLNRSIIDYEDIIRDWAGTLESIQETTGFRMPLSVDEAREKVNDLFLPELRRRRIPGHDDAAVEMPVFEPYRKLKIALQTPAIWSYETADEVRCHFNRIADHRHFEEGFEFEPGMPAQSHRVISRQVSALLDAHFTRFTSSP